MSLPPAITDTNILLQISAAIARGETHSTFEAIRTRCFITRSVDEEATERSWSRARKRFKLEPMDMQRAWLHDVRPHLRVVDITSDELDDAAIDQVRARNADQADIDTAALAVLLSPCMVISGDDDLRAVARPNLAPDVLRKVRHAEPSIHTVARSRSPLVGTHSLKQGALVGGHMAWDMAEQSCSWLRRNGLGLPVIIVGAATIYALTRNEAVRGKAGAIARAIADAAGEVQIATLLAEAECTTRMFPRVEPQSLAHRIAHEIAHTPFWLAPEALATSTGEEMEQVRAACQHKWFTPGVFGSVKVGVKHDAPAVIDLDAS